jgi:hypothetical protein
MRPFADRPRLSHHLPRHPGINFSNMDVGGDLGGFIFAAGTTVAVLIGLPQLAPLYVASVVLGALFACVLHGWVRR